MMQKDERSVNGNETWTDRSLENNRDNWCNKKETYLKDEGVNNARQAERWGDAKPLTQKTYTPILEEGQGVSIEDEETTIQGY